MPRSSGPVPEDVLVSSCLGSSLGGKASPNAVQEELGPGRSHGAVKQLMWRMAEMWLLVAAEGKYRRNEGIPGRTLLLHKAVLPMVPLLPMRPMQRRGTCH